MARPDLRLGIDLGGSKIEGVVLDPDGNTLMRDRVATPQGDYQGTLRAVAELVTVCEDRVGQTCRIGIGMPGSMVRVKYIRHTFDVDNNKLTMNNRQINYDLEIVQGLRSWASFCILATH